MRISNPSTSWSNIWTMEWLNYSVAPPMKTKWRLPITISSQLICSLSTVVLTNSSNNRVWVRPELQDYCKLLLSKVSCPELIIHLLLQLFITIAASPKNIRASDALRLLMHTPTNLLLWLRNSATLLLRSTCISRQWATDIGPPSLISQIPTMQWWTMYKMGNPPWLKGWFNNNKPLKWLLLNTKAQAIS